jgi:hypothetical protein
MGLPDAVRGLVNQIYMPPILLAHCTSHDNMGYGSCIPNAPPLPIAKGSTKAQGSEVKPTSRVRAIQSDQS